MSAKHTPGPWRAIAKADPDPCEGTHWIQCGIGALGYWRGHKQDHTDSNWILNEPDARLISAAPDLLEALKMAVLQNDHDMLMTGEELRIARAAITKATGSEA